MNLRASNYVLGMAVKLFLISLSSILGEFMSVEVIILAAGKGSRMHTHLPKVLHQIGGQPLLGHVIANAKQLNPAAIHIVYGYGGAEVRTQIGENYHWVEQKEQLGTGHAVLQALPACADQNTVVVLFGDMPLITPQKLTELVAQVEATHGVGIMTACVDNPFGLGRIKRDPEGLVEAIVEEKDCSAAEKLIKEIYTGVIAASGAVLKQLLAEVTNDNAQHEYYLTDIIALGRKHNLKVSALINPCVEECLGINDKVQLAQAERIYQRRVIKSYMQAGLIVADPERLDIRGELTFGSNTFVDINVIIEGNVKLGHNVVVGAGSVLKNCVIDDDSVISPYTVIEDSDIGRGATLGPFARFRPGCTLKENVHVGNFVEVKKSTLAAGTKAGHLSYLGDSDIGTNVNIGAGTITCNYDGANKWKTIIGDDVFVGSDTQLVAPVEVGAGATIGAGTTVTKNVAPNTLVITRAKLREIEGWKRPQKIKK